MSKKTKKSNKKTKPKKVNKAKNIGLIYKAIALSFIAATIVLSLIIFFVSSAKTTITLTTKESEVNTQENIEILLNQEPVNQNQTEGKLVETEVELTKTFTLDHGELQEAQATGEVTVINNYSKNQPLIATTRLLSEDGILFRLDETINVPAGGEVSAKIYADEPGKAGEIGPSKFTIPGLWEGLQNQIYAVSQEPTTGGTRKISTLKQADIDKAVGEAKELILEEGLAKLNLELANLENSANYQINKDLISHQITKRVVNAEVGEEVSEFEIEMTAMLSTVAFSEDEIFEITKNKLESSLSEGQKLTRINRDSFSFTLEDYDSETGKVGVTTSLGGMAEIEPVNSAINKQEILGKTKAELDEYFRQHQDKFSKVEYHFSPFWLKHAATSENKIKIIVK